MLTYTFTIVYYIYSHAKSQVNSTKLKNLLKCPVSTLLLVKVGCFCAFG